MKFATQISPLLNFSDDAFPNVTLKLEIEEIRIAVLNKIQKSVEKNCHPNVKNKIYRVLVFWI